MYCLYGFCNIFLNSNSSKAFHQRYNIQYMGFAYIPNYRHCIPYSHNIQCMGFAIVFLNNNSSEAFHQACYGHNISMIYKTKSSLQSHLLHFNIVDKLVHNKWEHYRRTNLRHGKYKPIYILSEHQPFPSLYLQSKVFSSPNPHQCPHLPLQSKREFGTQAHTEWIRVKENNPSEPSTEIKQKR